MNKLRDFNIPIPETSDNCIILISAVKEEFLLLDYFIKFYTSIGVTHFIFIENNSSDDTLKYLLELDNNIMVFQTKESYKSSMCGILWINTILKLHCKDKWCVVADSDEIMHIKDLNVLRDAMIKEGANWCKFYLLDMYSKTDNKEYIKGEPFLTHSKYYDKESSINNDFFSGVRKRVMNVSACLTKVSFFNFTFHNHAYLIIGQHAIHNLKKTDKKFSITQILLHFKFIKPNLSDFFAKRLEDHKDDNSKDYADYHTNINICKDYNKHIINFGCNFYHPEYSLYIEDTEPSFHFIHDLILSNNFEFKDENSKIINHLEMETIEQEQAQRYITSDCIVLELGARYGTVSCIINKIVGSNMVSVEPDTRVQDALEQNMKANGCDFNIVKGVISRVPLILTNLDNWHGGYGATTVKSDESSIPSTTLEEVETKYNLTFNTLVADCEGFLEQFMDENPKLYKQLSLILFEKDYCQKCNYKKIEDTLKGNGFTCLDGSFHSVWKKL